MKPSVLLFFFSLFFSFHLFAQNLLMNGGFEDENICSEYQKNCAPEGWISTSLTADYYFDDAPHAFKGRHFTGLILAPASEPQVRNFLRSRLLCGLRKGAQYNLEFYIRVLNNGLDSVGIYFSANDFLYQKEKIKSSHPQLYLKEAAGLKPGEDWQKVSLVYTATGEENFITIGDFKTRGYLAFGRRADLNNSYYFFLDELKLTPLNPQEHICNEAGSVMEDEYSLNVRHTQLDRLIYIHTKNPPEVEPLPKTILQRIDTLVIPDVLFATASYALSPKANKVLDSFITLTRRLQIDSVAVEGHTDSQGGQPANEKLSAARAASVAAALQPYLHTPFYTRGWASTKPVADNKTPAGRQKNRRVEIYVYVRE